MNYDILPAHVKLLTLAGRIRISNAGISLRPASAAMQPDHRDSETQRFTMPNENFKRGWERIDWSNWNGKLVQPTIDKKPDYLTTPLPTLAPGQGSVRPIRDGEPLPDVLETTWVVQPTPLGHESGT
jgi:hypothetical protein